MADTLTANIQITNQTEGANNNTWGTIADANFERIDNAFGDTTSISTTGGDTTLTDTQEIVAVIDVSGTLVSNVNIIFSGRGGFWIVRNDSTGAFTVTCKVSGQTGVVVDQGLSKIIFCDGTDIAFGNTSADAQAEDTLASATTANILGSDSEFVAISGTTTITSFGTGTNRKRFVRATGAFTLTHNATSLILPGGQNIVTQSGDTFIVISDASSNCRVYAYQRSAQPPPYQPIGMIADYAGSTAPALWLLCYGQEVSRTTYAGLFAVVSTTFGAGDASTTFNLPDCRGRVRAGLDNMGGSDAGRLGDILTGTTIGSTGGSETVTLTTDQLAAHQHGPGTLSTNNSGNHTHNYQRGNVNARSVSGTGGGFVTDGETTTATSGDGNHSHSVTAGVTASAGGGEAHSNLQPTMVFNTIIFAGV
jgi:microcystin-dependent protein